MLTGLSSRESWSVFPLRTDCIISSMTLLERVRPIAFGMTIGLLDLVVGSLISRPVLEITRADIVTSEDPTRCVKISVEFLASLLQMLEYFRSSSKEMRDTAQYEVTVVSSFLDKRKIGQRGKVLSKQDE